MERCMDIILFVCVCVLYSVINVTWLSYVLFKVYTIAQAFCNHQFSWCHRYNNIYLLGEFYLPCVLCRWCLGVWIKLESRPTRVLCCLLIQWLYFCMGESRNQCQVFCQPVLWRCLKYVHHIHSSIGKEHYKICQNFLIQNQIHHKIFSSIFIGWMCSFACWNFALYLCYFIPSGLEIAVSHCPFSDQFSLFG